MEVHAHSHTARKKWTHYFWEFLMLFLAVIAGFYAENIREHKVEARRGKEYIRSFLADLKSDTANYNFLLDVYAEKIKGLEQNYDCYVLIKNKAEYSQCLGEILESSLNFPDLITADRTLQQLKSSGALRLIPRQDADSITIYDALVRVQIQGERTGVQEGQTLLRNAYFDLLNYDEVYKRFLTPGEKKSTAGVSLLNIPDQSKVDRLFSLIGNYYHLMVGQYENISALKESAASLVNYFTTKYHFKD